MAGQARMIHEAMRIIGVEKPIIVGHSLGGTVALAYAVQFPEHISGIVSLAGYCFPTPRFDLMPIMLNGVPVVGPISAQERGVIIQTDSIGAKYDVLLDRDSADEVLAAKGNEAAAAAAAAKAETETQKATAEAAPARYSTPAT